MYTRTYVIEYTALIKRKYDTTMLFFSFFFFAVGWGGGLCVDWPSYYSLRLEKKDVMSLPSNKA